MNAEFDGWISRVALPRLLGGLALCIGLVGPAAAQVDLRVVDGEGRPIPAVRIDVYGVAELLEVESTSPGGTAELDAERWGEARRITLSHLGFRTLVVQVADVPVDGAIRLEPEAIAIEGLTVEAGRLCPILDEPGARRLWSEVASLYATDTGTRSWLAYLSRYGDTARGEDLYRTSDEESVDYVAAGGGAGVIHGGDHHPRPLDERVSTEGYAWPPLVVGGITSGREVAGGHRYPELDRAHAYHFASPVFGALHDFAVASTSEGRTTLVFCGNRGASGATIDGTITLVPGEAFVTAEWRFVTSGPDEGAGGSVTFAPYVEGPGSKPHLVASRGLFYRYSGLEPRHPELGGTFAREVATEVRWYLLPPGEKPCNTGLSYHLNPPRTPEGRRFARCVVDHWGRRQAPRDSETLFRCS